MFEITSGIVNKESVGNDIKSDSVTISSYTVDWDYHEYWVKGKNVFVWTLWKLIAAANFEERRSDSRGWYVGEIRDKSSAKTNWGWRGGLDYTTTSHPGDHGKIKAYGDFYPPWQIGGFGMCAWVEKTGPNYYDWKGDHYQTWTG